VKFSSLFCNEKGLTLMELVMAFAILLLVLGVSYTFYVYAARSSAVAASQANLQQNVRLARTLIENEIKFADYIKVGEEPPERENCRSIYLEDGKIMIQYENGTVKELLGGLSDDMAMDLLFTVSGNSFIETMVAARDGTNTFEITAKVLILKRSIDNKDKDSADRIYYADEL